MPLCPKCEGTKKITVRFVTTGGPSDEVELVELDCVTCGAAGIVSEKELQAIQDADAMWCRCGNPSGDANSFSDYQHPTCSKHCYTCADCGGILQVG